MHYQSSHQPLSSSFDQIRGTYPYGVAPSPSGLSVVSMDLETPKTISFKNRSARVENGYGTKWAGGGDIPPLSSIEIDIDMEVTVLTKDQFEETKCILEENLTEEQQDTLNQLYAGYSMAAGWFSSFFSLVLGDGDYHSNRNAIKIYDWRSTLSKLDDSSRLAIDRITCQKAHLKGRFRTSNPRPYPISVKVLFEVTKMTFDGRVLMAISPSNAVAVDKQGNTYPNEIPSHAEPITIVSKRRSLL